MLIILPPSETKRPAPDAGPLLDLEALSFPALNPTRLRILDALIETSRASDALRRLRVRPSLAREVARNTSLRELPTRSALETYSGPLYDGLSPASWSSDTRRRAARELVIVSALWGAIRPDDSIPPYRLHVCSGLVRLDRLEPMWRTVLPAVLADAASLRGPILDLRSPTYQAMGHPQGLDAETVTLRVRPPAEGPPHVGDVIAKRVRGQAARYLLSSSTHLQEPLDIADVLAARWSLELEPPAARKRSWTIVLVAGRL